MNIRKYIKKKLLIAKIQTELNSIYSNLWMIDSHDERLKVNYKLAAYYKAIRKLKAL